MSVDMVRMRSGSFLREHYRLYLKYMMDDWTFLKRELPPFLNLYDNAADFGVSRLT